jgi:hypothetical protein
VTAPGESPDLAALVAVLHDHGVRYVVTGSVAALLHGVDLQPGDLDIVPALDEDDLERLARVLAAIDARIPADAPFGDWRTEPGGDRRWIERPPRPGEVEARLAWRPVPSDPGSFDHRFQTRLGALDVVPDVAGTYDGLSSRATLVERFGVEIRVAAVADLLAAITVPRRARDGERVRALRAIQRRQAAGPELRQGPSVR